MNLTQRIAAFIELGNQINRLNADEKATLADQAAQRNPWFTFDYVTQALEGVAHLISSKSLDQWTNAYLLERANPKTVGVAMAGNIPMVGFHDFLCVLISGNRLKAKLSSQDAVLLQAMAQKLIQIEPHFQPLIHFEERLNNVDAVIATGSDNTSRYFEYYFRNIPNIIRKNRSSCAIIMGEETPEQLTDLGKDVFTYFGLGCRNVSKVFVPEGYNFTPLLDSWHGYSDIANHHKYANNYDYQKSILLVNGVKFLDNGFVLVTENPSLVSPISVLFFETYKDQTDLGNKLLLQKEKIQCMVSAKSWCPGSVPFGKAQYPDVWDYADNIDTLKFLSGLN